MVSRRLASEFDSTPSCAPVGAKLWIQCSQYTAPKSLSLLKRGSLNRGASGREARGCLFPGVYLCHSTNVDTPQCTPTCEEQRARARLLHPRAGRRCTPRSRAPPMPRRRRRPFYSMGFARSAGALDIICAAGEASGSGVWRRLTRGRAQACVAWRRRAGAGREYRGAPGSARCLRSVGALERL